MIGHNHIEAGVSYFSSYLPASVNEVRKALLRSNGLYNGFFELDRLGESVQKSVNEI